MNSSDESKKKGCRLPGWPELRITEPEVCIYFDRARQNVGILTGIAGLADIDCDSPEAVITGRGLLPATGFVFGRESKRASHYFYYADTVLVSQQFADPLASAKGHNAIVLELRCGKADGGIGLQTCVPPSTHPSGEQVEFEPGGAGAPAKVSAKHLQQAARRAAAAAILARHWPGEGSRHAAFLALAGALCRAGWTVDEIVQFSTAVYSVVWPGDIDLRSCRAEVESTVKRLAAGDAAITGIPSLCGLMNERVVAAALEWVGINTAKSKSCATGRELESNPLSTAQLGEYVFDPDGDPPEERTYYEGLMGEGDLVVWLGREKHRKTNFILQFSICAATGRDFLVFGFAAARPLKVVVVDYETKTGSLRRRYAAICDALKLTGDERTALRDNLRVIEVRKLVRAGQSIPRFMMNGKVSHDEDVVAHSRVFWRRFAEQYPADICIFHPMRSMHSGDENDSSIEMLLGRMRRFFPNSAVIVAHHMRKQFAGSKEPALLEDMRAWSDGARGSSAIKAHTDVVVCQERTMTNQDDERDYLGAILKDRADISP